MSQHSTVMPMILNPSDIGLADAEPKHVEGNFLRGWIHMHDGQYEQAHDHFERAVCSMRCDAMRDVTKDRKQIAAYICYLHSSTELHSMQSADFHHWQLSELCFQSNFSQLFKKGILTLLLFAFFAFFSHSGHRATHPRACRAVSRLLLRLFVATRQGATRLQPPAVRVAGTCGRMAGHLRLLTRAEYAQSS